MNKLNKIIDIIRENMVANPPGQSGGFSASGNPTTTAGFDPVVGFTRRRKKPDLIDGRTVKNRSYLKWLRALGVYK